MQELSETAAKLLMNLIEKRADLKHIEKSLAFSYFEQTFEQIDMSLENKKGWQEVFTSKEFQEWVLHYLGILMEEKSMAENMMLLISIMYNFIYQNKQVKLNFCQKIDHIVVVRAKELEKPKMTFTFKDNEH